MPFSKQGLLAVPGVTQLTFFDEPLLRLVFSGNTTYYANSWLYALRASHIDGGGLGYKFLSEHLVASIGYRRGFIYVTPLFDNTRGIQLQQLCKELRDATNRPLVLKKLLTDNLDPGVMSELQRKSPAPFEDDSQPETILQLDKLFASQDGMLNPIAKKLARRARAFEASGPKLTIKDNLQNISFPTLDKFLSKWPEKYDSYISMVRYLRAQPKTPQPYRLRVYMEQEQVKGLYLAEKLSHNKIGLYCGVTAKDTPAMTEWMDINFFSTLYKERVRIVYLGGSEHSGVARFVDKLLPYRPEYESFAASYQPTRKNITVSIRLATSQDITPLAKLYRESYNALNDLGEHWTTESARKFISHFFRRQPDLFFVAEYDGKIIGATVAAVQPWWDGNRLVEGELFTHSGYNQKGVEKALLKELLLAAQRKYCVVGWDTILPKLQSHPFGMFESVGFKEVSHWRAVSGDLTTMLAHLEG